MPRIQTRKSVSLKGDTYKKLRAHANKTGSSMSSVLEELLKDLFQEDAIDTIEDHMQSLAVVKVSASMSGIQTF